MRMPRGSRKGYKLGNEVQATVPCSLIKHDKSDVSSILLETAPV